MSLKPDPIQPVPEATARLPAGCTQCTPVPERGLRPQDANSHARADKPAAARENPCLAHSPVCQMAATGPRSKPAPRRSGRDSEKALSGARRRHYRPPTRPSRRPQRPATSSRPLPVQMSIPGAPALSRDAPHRTPASRQPRASTFWPAPSVSRHPRSPSHPLVQLADGPDPPRAQRLSPASRRAGRGRPACTPVWLRASPKPVGNRQGSRQVTSRLRPAAAVIRPIHRPILSAYSFLLRGRTTYERIVLPRRQLALLVSKLEHAGIYNTVTNRD